MRHTVLLGLLTLSLAVGLGACRGEPPPSAKDKAGAPGVVARREAGKEDLAAQISIDLGCSDFATTQDQIVCIKNASDQPVDISEWLVRNALGRTYYFPKGTKIDGGKTIKLHTAAGTNDAGNLYWNYEFKPVFDKKEQVTLVSTSNVDISKIVTP